MATDSIAQIILSKGAYFMSDTCDLKFVADDNTRLLYMYVKSKNGYFVASKGLTDYNKEFTRMMKAVKASNGKHRKLNEQWQINWGARDQK